MKDVVLVVEFSDSLVLIIDRKIFAEPRKVARCFAKSHALYSYSTHHVLLPQYRRLFGPQLDFVLFHPFRVSLNEFFNY